MTRQKSDSLTLFHAGHPVVTTGQLAAFLGTSVKRLGGLRRAISHGMRPGRHYHSLDSAETAALRAQAEGVHIAGGPPLIVWRALGAATVARILGSAAWERYEMLAQTYFAEVVPTRVLPPRTQVDIIKRPGGAGGVARVSSRDIAADANKRHDHVIRDIEKMIEDINVHMAEADRIDAPKFGGIYRDAYGREKPEYLLPPDLVLTLIAGYRADIRYRIVKRLEAMDAPPAPRTPPRLDEARPDIRRVAYIADNLRRVQDMADRVDAPMDAEALWTWITAQAVHPGALADLAPHDAADLLANIAGLPYTARRAAGVGAEAVT